VSTPVALVLVSHSARAAEGVVEIAEQMAPDVLILPAGGTDDGGIGTSYTKVSDTVARALGTAGVRGVALLTDLGSATLMAEAVLDDLEGEPVALAEGPFLEGAVAAGVTAQLGGDLAAVRRAVADAAAKLAAAEPVAGAPRAPGAPQEAGAEGPVLRRVVVLRNRLGLHARPASVLAREAREHRATVTVGGARAEDVLEVIGLGLAGGSEVVLTAQGPDAEPALDALVALVESGFDEA
jgi:PTS hybrid protein